MADARTEHDAAPSLADYVEKDGSVPFTGQPTYDGRGGFLHHNNSANTSGRIFIAASGGSAPSGAANGDFWAEY